MYFVQYFPCVIEAVEKRARASLLARWKQPMLARNVPRVSRKTIRTEYFTAYRPDSFLSSPSLRKPKQAENPALSFLGRSCCGCHELLARFIARLARQGRSDECPRRMGIEPSVLVREPAFCCR